MPNVGVGYWKLVGLMLLALPQDVTNEMNMHETFLQGASCLLQVPWIVRIYIFSTQRGTDRADDFFLGLLACMTISLLGVYFFFFFFFSPFPLLQQRTNTPVTTPFIFFCSPEKIGREHRSGAYGGGL